MLVTRRTVRKMEREHEAAAYTAIQREARLREEVDALRTMLSGEQGRNLVLKTERDLYRERLAAVAAMETPSCAHIGKRMAKVAREGVGR
jgi:hypothetical protein